MGIPTTCQPVSSGQLLHLCCSPPAETLGRCWSGVSLVFWLYCCLAGNKDLRLQGALDIRVSIMPPYPPVGSGCNCQADGRCRAEMSRLCWFARAAIIKYHRLGGLDNRTVFLTILKTRGLRARCWQSCFLLRPPSLLVLPVPSPGLSPVCVCIPVSSS